MRCLASLVLLLVIAYPTGAQPVRGQIPDQYFTVVPGARLGPIALGEQLEALYARLGIPQDRSGAYVWELQPPLGTLLAITDQSGRITRIKTYWTAAYETPNHLHIGLMESDVRESLGRAIWVVRWSHYRTLYYQGVFFQIDLSSEIVMGSA